MPSAHGTIPVPAPAVAELLAGFTVHEGGATRELVALYEEKMGAPGRAAPVLARLAEELEDLVNRSRVSPGPPA
mgnify:CR=1 FL=1